MVWQEFYLLFSHFIKTSINIDDYSERQVVNQIFEIDRNKYSEYKKELSKIKNDNKKY